MVDFDCHEHSIGCQCRYAEDFMKKTIIALILTCVVMLCLVSCKPPLPEKPNDNENPPAPPAEETAFIDSTVNFGDDVTKANDKFYKDYSAEEKQLYYTLWQNDTSICVKIDISAYELKKIDEAHSHYSSTGNSTRSDTYRKCNLTITVNGIDYVFDEVGIRMRGNTSRRNFVDSDGQIYNLVHFRFSLNETFDGDEYKEGSWASELYHDWTDDQAGKQARDDRTFATMKKFYVKWNKNYDQTYSREIYANKMFAECGVLCPHVTLANVNLKQNGVFENLGVFTLYETIDKQFIKRNFDKEHRGGDLYKCTYSSAPANLTTGDERGVETPTQRFVYSLKTNDDRTSADYNHHQYLLALIDTLNKNGIAQSDFCDELEKVADMDNFSRFEAANYLLGNPDCFKNNANNYYLYFTPEGVAYFIPYDYDRCLGITMDWNPSGDAMISAKPFETTSVTGTPVSPMYTKTILDGGVPKYKTLYASKLNYVLNKMQVFTASAFVEVFNAYQNTYATKAIPSDYIITRCNLDAARLKFSIGGASAPSGTSQNYPTDKYIDQKRATAIEALNAVK